MKDAEQHREQVFDKLVGERFPLDEETKRLINLANQDLYYGPITVSVFCTCRGFEEATKTISNALNEVCDVYVDMNCESLSDTLDEGYENEETGEWVVYVQENMWALSRKDVLSYLVGDELVQYL